MSRENCAKGIDLSRDRAQKSPLRQTCEPRVPPPGHKIHSNIPRRRHRTPQCKSRCRQSHVSSLPQGWESKRRSEEGHERNLRMRGDSVFVVVVVVASVVQRIATFESVPAFVACPFRTAFPWSERSSTCGDRRLREAGDPHSPRPNSNSNSNANA